MGDTFSNVSGSTIINRSSVVGAVSSLQAKGASGEADALTSLARVIEQSGNREAGEYFGGLTDELQRPEPRKSILRSMWTGIKEILPSVPKMLEIADGVERMIES